ncbi:PucR family transcriptional regulator [Actinomadura welshii]
MPGRDAARPARGRAALDRVIDRLAAESGTLTERTIALVGDLPSYAAVPVSNLEASGRRNLAAAVETLRSGAAPAPDDLAPTAEITVRERASQGVPIEDMMRAYRSNIGVIHDRFAELAEGGGVPSRLVLLGARLLWALSDAFTTRIALEYQNLGIDNALREAHRRSELLHALLSGTLETAGLAGDCAFYGLDTAARYHAVRAHVGGEDVEQARRALERLGSTPARRALVGMIGGHCAGIVARRPAPLDGVVVGIGDAVPPADMAASFATAGRVLEAARRLGRTGVFGIEDLSWRVAAAHEPQVGELLARRYLAPLREHGEFGGLLMETVRTYLAHEQSIARTADALVVHVNTLRHRLRRFEELTGRSLSAVDTLVELAWVLETAPTCDDRDIGGPR